ncbi:ABC transporter substrate-binding protein [Salinisphaera aquimarina]|uniref:ABC transporter substrate-binding protein n=1 Tax=Salinisphaera aquimarina TaxID=2094031 RepID=UPI0036D39B6B
MSALCMGALLGALLSACGSDGGDADQSASAKQGDDLAQGVTQDQILIGHLGPQTGPVAIYDQVREGIESYFNYVNEQGGVKGHKLKLIAYDDQYQPSKTVKLARRLVEEDKVFAILGDIGTPTNTAIKDYLVDSGIPVVMLSSGSSQFVNPPIKNFMGSSIINYEFEAKLLADYAVNTLGAKKIAIAYQNDDYGTPLGEAAKEALKGFDGVEVVQEVNFQAGDADLSSQAQRLKRANPDAILDFAVPAPAAKLKKALFDIGFTKPPFIVSSVGANEKKLFDLAGKEVWNGTYSSAVYPMPEESDSDVMKVFVKQFSGDFPQSPLAGSAQVGWAAAQVLVEALKRTDKLTWDDFLASFNSFDNWDGSMYSGVTFSKDNHYGLTSLFITQAKDGKIVPISDPISFDPATGEINAPEQGGDKMGDDKASEDKEKSGDSGSN